MRRICFALAFLLFFCSGAHGQSKIPVLASVCLPTEYTDGQVTRNALCVHVLDYSPQSYGKDRTAEPHEKPETVTVKETKADSLAAPRPVTAGAAPK